MQRSNQSALTLLSVIVIGVVNIVSLSVIYAAFHDALKPAGPAPARTVMAPDDGAYSTGGSAGGTGQAGPPVNRLGGNPQTGQPVSAGGNLPMSSGGSAGLAAGSVSNSGSGTPSASTGLDSLAKGPPCKTQIPPAGVCTAVLSINSQKDGNPYWSPSLLAAIKQEITDDNDVRLLGLNPTTIYNSVQVSLNESTWSGNASHGTIGGTTSAEGQSQPATFTLDWNGRKWIVDDAKLD